MFLDEIGELEPAIQVKLLRVLQTRTFQRLGETRDRRFQGKIVAATNRDLAREMPAGRFREDLYYRLCSDLIAHARRSPSSSRDAPRRAGGRWSASSPGAVAGDAEAESLARGGRRPGSTRTSGPTIAGRATSASWSSAYAT